MHDRIFDATVAALVARGSADPARLPHLAAHLAAARRYFIDYAHRDGWLEGEAQERARLHVAAAFLAAATGLGVDDNLVQVTQSACRARGDFPHRLRFAGVLNGGR